MTFTFSRLHHRVSQLVSWLRSWPGWQSGR